MGLIPTLILAPMVAALALLFVKNDRMRSGIVLTAVFVLFVGSAGIAGAFLPRDPTRLPAPSEWVSELMLAVEVFLTGYLVWLARRHKRPLVGILAVAQLAVLLPVELGGGVHAGTVNNLFVDRFSVIMALIIGFVGGLICLYALGYMREFHEKHHPEVQDRRARFFAILFLFLGAMYGVIFSNNLLWLFFFWELTTLCSFWLIGYKQDPTSKKNSFRALKLNLVGGLCFAIAIAALHFGGGYLELSHLLESKGSVAMLPVVLLAIAGMTKSAQLPWSSWLLGAMVAPTPVSAMLHSSTMVKAGVYLVVRLAPILQGTPAGTLVALVGALTFLITSIAAVGASDAKRVLALSTVANLGLIVLCAGIGTYEAVWAAVLLIIFHAVAKCLLFLCVGVIEHKVHDRNIEAMGGLIVSMPRVAVMLQIGMAGMFLAPFGMLISKWAVLKAVIDALPLFAVFVVFGSAATLFFWVKWMGKLLEVSRPLTNVEKEIGAGEWTALVALSALTFFTCLFYPLVSSHLIEPYVIAIYGRTATMAAGNIVIMTIMLALVALFPFSFLNYGHGRVKVVDPYLGGRNTDESPVRFHGSAGATRDMAMGNYYLGDLVSEAKLMSTGVFLCAALLLFLVGGALV